MSPAHPEPGDRQSGVGPGGEPQDAAPSPQGAPDAAHDPAPDQPIDDVVEPGSDQLDQPGESDQAAPASEAETALAERTADLQRLQAEFLNYKRRVERDRDLVRENATYAVLTPIVEVLDTIDRARESAERSGEPLEAGLRSVADQLERVVAGLGLTKFGAPGDPFDPTIHEALSNVGEDPDITVTTCRVIAKSGYRIGDRVVRAAQVLVAEPAA